MAICCYDVAPSVCRPCASLSFAEARGCRSYTVLRPSCSKLCQPSIAFFIESALLDLIAFFKFSRAASIDLLLSAAYFIPLRQAFFLSDIRAVRPGFNFHLFFFRRSFPAFASASLTIFCMSDSDSPLDDFDAHLLLFSCSPGLLPLH